MNLRPPKMLADLYGDLRDRHLLIPVVALLAALVAVPVLLAKSPEPAPPPAAAALAGDDATATEAAVVTREVSIRDYKERLDQLRSKNPFRQDDIPLPSGTGLEATDPGGDDALSGDDGATGAATPSTGAATEPIGAPGGSGTSGGSTPSGTGGNQPTTQPAPPPVIEPRYFTRRIDVTVGPEGNVRRRDGVKQLTLLPRDAKPVVAFLGVTESGTSAVFAVSGDVTAVSGDGRCVPDPANCAYLVLAEGEEARFEYSPDGLTYRLVLRKVRSVQLKSEPGLDPGA